jgi:Arc/MetJ-type ribon-helix-helix transcriptional regulator
MTTFDYTAPAELFPGRAHHSRYGPVGYRRFGSAADAIRFAIEELRAEFLAGAYLEVEEERFDRHGIKRLYESADYPLVRQAVEPGSGDVHGGTALSPTHPHPRTAKASLGAAEKRDVRGALT